MRLLLPQASANAGELDALLWALFAVSVLVLILVFGLMLFYVARYRDGSQAPRGKPEEKTWKIEIAWTGVTLACFFGLFIWGADLYVRLYHTPEHATRIAVVGKQWMWKIQYPGGQSEINTLHVPVDRPIELLMSSEDVIHDFSVPAFRIKHDALPGRYESIWFTATKPGTYHLFCTQFCGTDHSVMGGNVVVMTGPAYADWLASSKNSVDLVAQGRGLFVRDGCSGCHAAEGRGGGGTVRAPNLDAVYGHPVPIADQGIVTASDQYIRDSILMPSKQIVAGYANQMPSFAGVIGEDDLIRLIAYIKSLGGGEPGS